MKYEKAEQTLPDFIVKMIQEYIDGCYVYIPRKEENRKAWGQQTDYKNDLKRRNSAICDKFKRGETIRSLAGEYYLTEQTIRRIIREEKDHVPARNKHQLEK